jgi:hypothetical protein
MIASKACGSLHKHSARTRNCILSSDEVCHTAAMMRCLVLIARPCPAGRRRAPREPRFGEVGQAWSPRYRPINEGTCCRPRRRTGGTRCPSPRDHPLVVFASAQRCTGRVFVSCTAIGQFEATAPEKILERLLQVERGWRKVGQSNRKEHRKV